MNRHLTPDFSAVKLLAMPKFKPKTLCATDFSVINIGGKVDPAL